MVKAAREIESSLNSRLLADLRTIFEGKEHIGAVQLSTKTILAEAVTRGSAVQKMTVALDD